jgi:hypothetical protein
MADHCRNCDPMLRARSITCHSCKAISYPLTAAWVSDELILVTYDRTHGPGCPGRHGSGTALIDDSLDGGDLAWPRRPRICRAVAVTTGKPCKSAARPGSAFCHSHQDRARSEPS